MRFPKDINAELGTAAMAMPPWALDLLDDLDANASRAWTRLGSTYRSCRSSRTAQQLEPHHAVDLSRRPNDRLAAAVAAHSDRFAGFAALPMSGPQAAADELRRSVLGARCSI
ncbi:MAG: amidohydrolase family protein [Actinomycetota bacterium]|nr:amidohydrolase family protein [Actinomycetota bacterium]